MKAAWLSAVGLLAMLVAVTSRAAVVTDASSGCHDDVGAIARVSASGIARFTPWQRGGTLTSTMVLPYGYIATGAGDALVATGLMAGAALLPPGHTATLVFSGFAVAAAGAPPMAGVSVYVGAGGMTPAAASRHLAGISTVTARWRLAGDRDVPEAAVSATSPGHSVGLLRRSERATANAADSMPGSVGLAAKYRSHLLNLGIGSDRVVR